MAISVVIGHSWHDGLIFVGGRNAVQLFYIISGFLMSYILVEKKSYDSAMKFYLNRALRLYPIYITVAIISLILTAISESNFFEIYNNIPASADFLLIFSNIFLFGQDWVLFSGIENGKLVFTEDFSKSEQLLYLGLLVPQAWTLGVELCFYLIAPLVLNNRRLIYLLLILSIIIRGYLIFQGLGKNDPWTYRFFPAELVFFLGGALVHQVLVPRYKNTLKGDYSKIATLLTVLYVIFYSFIPLKETVRTIVLFVLFLVMLPLLFSFQNQSKLDKEIGSLSYPVYIVHVFVIGLMELFSKRVGAIDPLYNLVFVVLLSLLFAMILDIFIGKKIEKIRLHIRHSYP
nr:MULTISPECIES: acyltransferase [Methylomonas]